MSTSNENLSGPVDEDGERVPQGVAPKSAKASDSPGSDDFPTLHYSDGGEVFDYRKIFAPKGHNPARA